MNIIIRIFFALIWLLGVYKWGDWRNWRNYYPTILFFILGNFMYLTIFHDKFLWELQSKFISFPFPDFYMSFIIFTPTTLIFLPHFPKNFTNKILYVISWAILYTFIESVYLKIGFIAHNHPWNLWFSGLHNLYQFPTLKLHHEKPLHAWVIALIVIIIFISVFKIPVLYK